MLKSSLSSKLGKKHHGSKHGLSSRTYSKGQWFLISAVMATGAFLAISGLFKTYFTVDPSTVARTNEDFYFSNIKDQYASVAASSDCSELSSSLREFKAFTEREMANQGYLLYLNYSLSGCSASQPGILLVSERLIMCQNVNVGDILPNVTLTCART